MKKHLKKLSCYLILLTFLAALMAGCGAKNSVPVNLTVSAAASLKDAMEEIQTIYAQEKTNVTLTYNFGGSGALQQQIEQGAPADLFISAATSNMDTLVSKGLMVEDSKKDLLENKVVLIAPANSTKITDFSSLAETDVRNVALGEPDSVPAGKYAKEILTKLEIWDQVSAKTVFAKDVRQVLNYVETENVDAGIVYQTDAKTSDKVKVIAEAPDGSHTPVVYPLAVVKSGKNQEAAQAFAAFLAGDKAKTVFENYGFNVIAK